MATSTTIICGVCVNQHITNYAEFWCLECEEGLCVDCHRYHSVSKASKTHGCIPVDQYNKLPPSISKIVQHCKDHEIKYTNYCTTHDTLCCPDCISTTHGECKGFLSLREIIKTAKTSTLLNDLEQSLEDIERNIEKIIQNKKQNLSNIKQQQKKIHEDIKKHRDKIISHLDSLEQNLITELNTAEEKIETKIGNLIHRLSKERQFVHALKINIESLKKNASDLQIFLGNKMYQPEVDKAERYMKSLSEDGSLGELNLKCNTNDAILKTLLELPFGSVSIEIDSHQLVLTTEKEKQAQMMTVKPKSSPKSIHDIKLSLLRTYHLPETGFMGYKCCIFHPRKMKWLITDRSTSKLFILGPRDRVVPCSSPANDVTAIDNKIVAVSTVKGIDFINIDINRMENILRTDNRCYGIPYHNGILLWCEQSKGIQRMDLSKWNITTLVNQNQLPEESYVTTNGDKIYQTNNKTETVTCYTMKGEKLWEYRNPSVLKCPVGITVDNNGNCYVTSYSSYDVAVISADGKNGKQLLSQTDGLKWPYGIYYDKSDENLFIVNRHGPAFLYHVL